MKKIIIPSLITLLVVVIVSFFYFNTPQKKTERTVENYLKSNLDDPSKFEAVEFSKIDTFYDFPDSPQKEFLDKYENAKEKVEEFNKEVEMDNSNINNYPSLKEYTLKDLTEHKDSLTHYLNYIKNNKAAFEKDSAYEDVYREKNKTQKGWRIRLKYRCSNKFGAIILNEDCFLVDLNYKIIEL